MGEYHTIPLLVEQLDIKGALITIDAGGRYTEIVDTIVEGKGNYLMTLKDNQPKLIEEAKEVFSEVESNGFEDVESDRESSRGHGRIEERIYDAVPLGQDSPVGKKWKHLKTLVMGIFYRTIKGQMSREVRYRMSDLSSDQVERLGRSARAHWGIENKLHWVLDVSFGEDSNHTRRGHGAENLGKIRCLAKGLMGKVKDKQTVPNMMFQAALSPEFRTTILEKICASKN